MSEWNSECAKAHGQNWLAWLSHLKGQPATGLELGVFKGDSAEWMLSNIFTHPDARYWCVDTFQGSEEHTLAGLDCSGIEAEARARLERFGARKQIHKSRSDEALRGFLRDDRFDFVYVDAAHDAMNVLRDAVLAFDLLKVGGVMVFDDLEWEVMEQAIDRPKIAIEAFVACYSRRLEVIGKGWQLALKRTS